MRSASSFSNLNSDLSSVKRYCRDPVIAVSASRVEKCISGDRDGDFESGRRSPSDVARPNRQPIMLIRIVQEPHQWHDRTYDPNSQKLDDTKSGYISGDRDGYFESGRRSPSDVARPKRLPVILIRIVRECRAVA